MKLKPSYITGFSNGEGTFNVIRYPDGRVRPQFLLFNTNKRILERIKKTLRLGSPILMIIRVKDIIKRRKKCYRLQVRSKDDIKKIIFFFNKNPPIVKNKEYNLFKMTYKKWISGE